jgi:hypothetical protein
MPPLIARAAPVAEARGRANEHLAATRRHPHARSDGMRTRLLPIVTMSAGLFVGALALGALSQSCSGSGDAADAGAADVDLYGPGPCRDGTIRIAACTAADGGASPESFSDEACLSLDDVSRRQGVAHDDARAPSIEQPAEGAAIPSASPYTFTWRPGALALRRARPRALTAMDEWRRFVTLIPEAEAHCPPFNGVGYAVVFTAGAQEVLRAETSTRSYTPAEDAWARLRAVRGAIGVRVLAARFSASAVVEGPFDQSTERRFTLAP